MRACWLYEAPPDPLRNLKLRAACSQKYGRRCRPARGIQSLAEDHPGDVAPAPVGGKLNGDVNCRRTSLRFRTPRGNVKDSAVIQSANQLPFMSIRNSRTTTSPA